jgi:hypothetical protein
MDGEISRSIARRLSIRVEDADDAELFGPALERPPADDRKRTVR